MLDISDIFKNKELNTSRLLDFGFSQTEECYTISYGILNDQFQMNLAVTHGGIITVKVLDADTGEEYDLIHMPGASGAFVGSVINACEEKLKIIAEHCFDDAVFRNSQTRQIIDYVDRTYQDKLEFLWKKFPDNAIFRRKDKGKWYGAILTVARSKLGLEGIEPIEIIDLRGLPEEIEELIDGRRYFPGYHMNKKHWYTICLDGTVSTGEICERIDKSYSLAKK